MMSVSYVAQTHLILIVIGFVIVLLNITYLITNDERTSLTNCLEVLGRALAERQIIAEPPERLDRIANALLWIGCKLNLN